MQSVGKFISAARQQAGLSLEEISASTRISVRNLEAIENDDILAMPSPFFYKSFVSQFANELGIQPDVLGPLVAVSVAEMREPLVPGQDERLVKNAMIKPLSRRRSYKWIYSLASLLVVLVACSTFYAIWENAKGDLSHSTNGSTKDGAQPAAKSENRLQQPVAPNAARSEPERSADQSSALEPAEGFRVELSALEPTWLSIVSDGRRTFSGTLEPEQKKIFEGRERGRIRTGNAGGISFVFNGKPIGVLGPRGQVRIVVFTKDNYEVLQPEVGVALTSFNPIFEWKPLRVSAR